MATYRKKPVVIEATQWFQNGDHPEDGDPSTEGLVVRRYRRPDVSGLTECRQCSHTMHEHGWIDTLQGGHMVCPHDWIITSVEGEHYPCKPRTFELTYDAVQEPL